MTRPWIAFFVLVLFAVSVWFMSQKQTESSVGLIDERKLETNDNVDVAVVVPLVDHKPITFTAAERDAVRALTPVSDTSMMGTY